MEAYQKRVVAEKKELDGKLNKLVEFLDSDKFGNLPPEERTRMIRQSEIMKEYSDILGERIAAFGA